MIESLSGKISATAVHGIHLQCGPVEWEILASTRTIRDMAARTGQEVRLHTHLIVREDDLKLFGFSDRKERELFRALIGVSGIGAKQAIRILSFSPPTDLARFIEGADIESLGRIPGIGKKTAQKMVLALQGELVTEPDAAERGDDFSEIIESLVSMGFDKAAVRKTVATCAAGPAGAESSPRVREQNIFRTALLELSTREQGG
ncbi:Holliday junction branch migration protein RuvA [Spirochaeta africana]|uniref:Holliday junction branch migration complex subunit RuvA n=1 Tax=Spirochaeta africana (strain ATCC 700263 / DSM 8902 / Z-7692) TaxID=889378 RepID=H9UJB8_SPIAZ|nr:Holliday junction branch migration protein RuvA [Spirochaeta africana]AFG37611.1 Holliday junction DNA helicase, RuvA subunit [Spirochaeta africana DSM 8902]